MTKRERVKLYEFTYDEYLIYAQYLDQNLLSFQPRQEIDLHQFNVSWNLTPFVFCWKISTFIHQDAALPPLTKDVAKCFLNATDIKANIWPSFYTRAGYSIIQTASLNVALSANVFFFSVALLLPHYSFNKLQNFSKYNMLCLIFSYCNLVADVKIIL